MADEVTAHRHHSSKNKASEPDSPAEFPGIEEGKQYSANGALEALGYEPELVRNRSTLQVAFMSFVLAAIPYGLATTFTYPLIGGGPVNIIWGWLAVSLITLCVAASLGEITSVYPTAGGVYYQTFMLSPPSYRRIASWICGWSYVIGNITITLAVNLGSTLFFISCINVFESAPGIGIFQAETYQVFLIFLAVTLFANAVSAFGNKWLPYLDTFAIFWTLAGLLAIVICVLAIAKEGRHDAEYVFTSFEPESGWPAGWSFCVGLLQAAYSTSSTGMVICMCEEVQHPSTQVPKAMVGTVIINTLAGFLFLIPLVFVLPDTKILAALESGQPVPSIIKSAIGSPVGSFLLLLPLIVLSLFCVIGCTTAVSRSTWAFARDGGIPGSIWWRQVNRDGVPFNAMMLGMVVQILLGFIYFGSSTAFNAFTGVGVITLTVSYACPIVVSLAGGRRHIKNGQFDLGTLGLACNIVALGWSILVIPLFCMPSSIPVAADTVNYAPVVFVAFILIASGWYWAWGVADSTDIERCSQCRQAFTDAFCMPHFWWSYFFRQGNGNFGCERTRDSGVTTGFNTWSKFAVKKVDPDTKFKWYHTNIFTRWLPSTNQTVVLAFDLDPAVKERFLRAVMKPNESWLNDPFWIYPYLVEQVALMEEPSVWAIRDHVRLTETEGKPEGRPQPDYRRLHDIARHAIHVNETLDIALQNVEHVLIQHESYTNSNPDNDSAASEGIHFRLRSWQSFIANLRSRSISNEKRLQNEIQLAFNTVAQHDASVTLEIGRATQLDSATMKTIAFVTLTFLPPTFICAIFSMSFFDFGGDSGWTMSNKFWIYWVFAIPTTVFTTLVWTYWPNVRRILFSNNE
ncbi:hypothetical protein N7517_003075 [Penicillium concentricum]|uniref:Amino acid permease/ SLC12A domain-containing protein n=1 Tax=Penicillium concentricum TaxID=293559 RepID=A0A9W9VL52_9EURO|nr:uncharacterized protein N7517_003075 [Penicillium concentricum]KAJ5385164.1 hypothetical protein N7517_003075 [Penicillium concentricum]